MLFKDLIKVYKVYYVHITEILERFAQLNFEDGQKAFKMYQSFVNLTDSIKSKANKLIYSFNFPIQLPDFYNPEKGLVDTLKVVVESNEPANVAEVAKKVRGGMNRDQFQGAGGNSKPSSKDNTDNDDGEKEYYFDCTILDKLQGPGGEEIKADTGIDLMEFISKSDFSTVGGQNNRANQPTNAGFDFNDFNTGSLEQPKAQTADVFFGNSNTQPKPNAGGMQDLMDIFSQPPPTSSVNKAQPVNINDIFAAGN